MQPGSGNHRRLAATQTAAMTRQPYFANRRHLQAAAPAVNASKAQPSLQGAPIPVIPDSKAYDAFITPTVSPLMTMQEMLCFVSGYSPKGLQGMALPDAGNATARNRSITCPAFPSKPTIFRYQNLVFKPVKIPVVFHCKYPLVLTQGAGGATTELTKGALGGSQEVLCGVARQSVCMLEGHPFRVLLCDYPYAHHYSPLLTIQSFHGTCVLDDQHQ